MKPLFLAFVLSAGFFAGSPEGLAAVEPAAVRGQAIHVKAKGLVCDFCARSLEKVFRKRPEVEDITVDLTTKEIRILLKGGQALDDETVRKLVTDSGYNVEAIERK